MSTKKRPDDQALRGMLLEGHFGQPQALVTTDPVTPTHMHLAIDRIKPYEHNPRRLSNPLYAQIKASIKAKQGLDDPIGITRRPGDDLYTVRAGGRPGIPHSAGLLPVRAVEIRKRLYDRAPDRERVTRRSRR